VSLEPLLLYYRSLSLNPARFDQLKVKLVGLDRVGLFDVRR